MNNNILVFKLKMVDFLTHFIMRAKHQISFSRIHDTPNFFIVLPNVLVFENSFIVPLSLYKPFGHPFFFFFFLLSARALVLKVANVTPMSFYNSSAVYLYAPRKNLCDKSHRHSQDPN